MNPLSINPLYALAAMAAAFAIGFGWGWQVNGWRLNGQISDIKAERAGDKASQATAALNDLVGAAKKVKAAADGAQIDVSILDAQLAAIRKDFNNANAKPLPVDCHPDAPRMLKLTTSIDAVDKAIARQLPGS